MSPKLISSEILSKANKILETEGGDLDSILKNRFGVVCCAWPNCRCDLVHPDLDNDGTPTVCPKKYNNTLVDRDCAMLDGKCDCKDSCEKYQEKQNKK